MIEIFKKSVLILVIFVLWQVVCELEIFTPYILPSPITTLKTMLDMSLSGELITHVMVSFKRIFVGYILAFVLASSFSFELSSMALSIKMGFKFEILFEKSLKFDLIKFTALGQRLSKTMPLEHKFLYEFLTSQT